MSRIDDLIREKCPNGVKQFKLSDVCDVLRGKRLTKNQLSAEKCEDFTFPVLHGGMEPMGYYNESNRKAGTTIVINTGNAGNVYYCDELFWSSDACFSLYPKGNNLLDRFLFFFVATKEDILHSKIRSGAMPTIDANAVESLKIPVPPLEIQQEIVDVLNSFTELETELETELNARRKQYEHYRDQLLSFESLTSEGGQVEFYEIGNICETITDYVAAGSFADLARNVKYLSEPDYAMLLRTMDIKNNYTSRNPIYISKDAYDYLWRVKLDGEESIILPNIGNCGEVYYLSDTLPYKHCALATNAILVRSGTVNNKFLFYLFQSPSFQKDLKKIVSPVGQTKFNKTDFKKMQLPIPPRNVQEHIVYMLDNFDEVCNDLNTGLPAEIAARHKQYEHYRDKLLSFKAA